MDESAALELIGRLVPNAGDDAAILEGGYVLTTDMLHETTDFPPGVTRYTAGWRSVGASLSDVAGMGADAIAAVAIYAAPAFIEEEIAAFVAGASDVCEAVGAEYVGGDMDIHTELTIATSAIGQTDRPIERRGARPGDAVYVTGTLGRTAAALALFEAGDVDRANTLFQFEPRIATGRMLADGATAMMDSSDGLSRSLHQLSAASGCGFEIDADAVPIDEAVIELAAAQSERREMGWYVGEDFELVLTGPPRAIDDIREEVRTPVTRIGRVTETQDVRVDGEVLPDRGHTHG